MSLPVVPAAACADACAQLGVPIRAAGVIPLDPGWTVSGPAVSVVHLGSVDVFLEACERMSPGDVLVVDDGGRTDRACAGDLTALEVRGAGGAGLVVWGCHRDSLQLAEVGLPVFSLGAMPNGPAGVDPGTGEPARLGGHVVEPGDWVVGDADGVVLLPGDRASELLAAAAEILATETAQADRMRAGESLRAQLDFAAYLAERERDPGYTLREHLRRRGGAIER